MGELDQQTGLTRCQEVLSEGTMHAPMVRRKRYFKGI